MDAGLASVSPDILLSAGVALGVAVAGSAVFLLVRRPKATTPKQLVRKESHNEGHFPAGRLDIYFGSQTGTAEGMAKALCEEAQRRGFRARAVDLEDFDVHALREAGRAIFLIATYGEGEPTDNAVGFAAWLRDEDAMLTPDTLEGLQYTVFGLGNRQYENFNRMGKTIDAGIAALGATRMFRYGEGDDDGTLEDDYDAWREELWPALTELFGASDGAVNAGAEAEVPFQVRFLAAPEAAKLRQTPISEAAASTRFYWEAREAKVVASRELRQPEDGGSTLHVEISLAGTGLTYETADNLSVLPENDPQLVRQLAVQMGYDLDAFFVVDHAEAGAKAVFPTPCTVEHALLRYIDLSAAPRRAILERLAPYVADASERKAMAALGSKEGRDALKKVVEEEHLGLGELLVERFPSVKVPLSVLLHVAPALHPRAYTVSSSRAVYPTTAHITMAVLRKERLSKTGPGFVGCCSRYLSRLSPPPASTNGHSNNKALSNGAAAAATAANEASNGSSSGSLPLVRVFVRASSFRLPKSPAAPVIMIGPGTGVAPMRALLQERRFQMRKASSSGGSNFGSCVLYFGCRRRAHDFLYAEELEEFVADGTLASLRLAFSRDKPGKKVYVQHLLAEDAQDTWEALQSGGHVYVCGGTSMGADVQRQLRAIVCKQGSMGDDAAGQYLDKMHAEGRYVAELWS